MAWHAQLDLLFRRDGARSVVEQRHSGPLRLLKSLHPEGPVVCHGVLVHPPGGVAGGDVLGIGLDVQAQAHALLTTPGATRFYRSAGEPALQSLEARVAPQARLEWLPLETICHAGTLAENRMRFELAEGAEMIGWDLLALGLPASDAPFDRGRVTQHIELPGVWLERGSVDGAAPRLLDSPLGWAGHRTMATMWFAAGAALRSERIEAVLDAARAVCADHPLAASSGSTAPNDRVVVLRVLAPNVEPAFGLLAGVWQRWRELAWGLPACTPRVWRT
jgi:urease accessory protein